MSAPTRAAEQTARCAEVQQAVTRTLVHSSSLDDALASVLAVVCTTFGWRAAASWIGERSTGRLHCAEFWKESDVPEELEVATRSLVFFEGYGIPGRICAQRKPAFFLSAELGPEFPRREMFLRAGFGGIIGVPVWLADEPVGVIEIFTDAAQPPDPELSRVLDTIGMQIGEFIRRTQVQQALLEEVRVTETLHRLGMSFATELDHNKLVQRITDEATTLAGADFGAFFFNVLNADGDAFLLYTLSGAPKGAFASFPLPRATPIFGPTFRGESVVRLDDVREDPRFGKWGPQPKGHLPVVSYLAVPVKTRTGEVLGGLFFAHKERGKFTPAHERTVAGLASHAAVALENARLYRDLQESEEKTRNAYTLAEESARRKDEFLAMLGHELRNPLAPILTALELLRMHGDDASTSKERQIIERQARHLLRLVDDLLDVSRITRGKIRLNKELVELSKVVSRAIEIASSLLDERGHNLKVEVPRENLLVDGDPVRLGQIFANLLMNAAKYTEPGGRITITSAREQDRVVVRVRDDGVGISLEMLPRLFDLFAQGERTLDRSQGGLGIGLTIAKRLVELHGGGIAANSDGPGTGSEFRVWLPAVDSPKERGTTAWSDRARSGIAVSEASRALRVLLVDDNRDAVVVLQQSLEKLGYIVSSAPDAPSALQLLPDFKPDVAVLDIGLPVMDGYELARRLRALSSTSELRLIALTGYGQESDRARAKAAGFDEHLVKPVGVEILVRALGGADRN